MRELAIDWLRQFGEDVEFVDLEAETSEAAFKGELVIRGAASVAHDKYEKLVPVAVAPADVDLPDSTEIERRLLDRPLPLDEVARTDESLGQVVQQALVHDRDFGGFADFYLRRLDEERKKAGGDPRRIALHEESFTPRLTATIVGASGTLHSILRVKVSYTVERQGPYQSHLRQLADPYQTLSSPDTDRCRETDRTLPVDCLETCQRSGGTALRHRMTVSERSGRHALSEYAVVCEATGRALLDDEVRTSAASGKRVDRQLLITSNVSGRLALRDELVRCEFTQIWMLPDEAETSEISGKVFRKDEVLRGGRQVRTGHRSEFRQCSETKKWLLPDEVAGSDVSNQVVDIELLATSEKSGRRGGPSESGVCAASGKLLLADELETCQVSGKRVDRGLLEPSAASGRFALGEELVSCERTGLRLLPSEVAICQATDKRVDKRLLQRSGASDALALPGAMEACAATGKLALPSELGVSCVSGKRAIPSEMRRCAATNQWALPIEMVVDVLDPPNLIIRSEAGFSEASARASLATNLDRCRWDGKLRLADEVALCELANVKVGKEYLNKENQLDALATFLAQPSRGRHVEQAIAEKVSIERIGLATRLDNLRFVQSPTGSTRAVVGARTRMLGFRKELVGFLLNEKNEVVGRPVVRSM